MRTEYIYTYRFVDVAGKQKGNHICSNQRMFPEEFREMYLYGMGVGVYKPVKEMNRLTVQEKVRTVKDSNWENIDLGEIR